jgi:hypothetical protein
MFQKERMKRKRLHLTPKVAGEEGHTKGQLEIITTITSKARHLVTNTCNPSYSGGSQLQAPQAKMFLRPHFIH